LANSQANLFGKVVHVPAALKRTSFVEQSIKGLPLACGCESDSEIIWIRHEVSAAYHMEAWGCDVIAERLRRLARFCNNEKALTRGVRATFA